MKIAEARQIYSTQIKAYQEQHTALFKQKKELEEKMKSAENGNIIYANEAATLELTIKAVEEQKNKYQEYMELYQAAKNIGAMMKQKEREEYDSLWEDEEKKASVEEPTEVADNAEVFASGPAIVEVQDVMETY